MNDIQLERNPLCIDPSAPPGSANPIYASPMPLPAPATDRTCLVTGASSGIGAEIARDLARRGLGVTLVARREDRLRSLADELTAEHGIRAEVLAADLTDASGRSDLLAALTALGLDIDILVNNAGFSTTGPVAAGDPDAELAMVELNVAAVTHLCALFVPGMVERGAGGVLNVASTAAFQPIPGQAGYGASKAFVLSYTQALDQELKGTGVRATALCPGPVATEFVEVAGFDPDEAERAMPSFMWVDAADVARTGVDALDSGTTVAIPGLANRATALASQLTPKRILLPLLDRLHPASSPKPS